MSKSRSQNPKPGKNGPNNAGSGSSASTTDPGKSQNQHPKDKGSEPKSAKPDSRPPTPPDSPHMRRTSLSGSSQFGGALNLHLGGFGDAAAADPSIRDPTAVAVSDLLGTMQGTLRALGNTFDVLGEQTLRVASLGPAVDALSQLEVVQRELNGMAVRQDKDMQEVKEKHLATVEGFSEVLRPRVNEIVAECVKKTIEERVHRQLTEQIPAALREELLRYRLRIMEARRDLHNSEARRHNALIHSSGLDEPLMPLLRPAHLSAPTRPDANADADEAPDASAGNDNGKQDKKNAKNKDKGSDKGKGPGRDKKKDNSTSLATPPSTTASTASATTSRTARQGAAANRLSVNTSVSAATSAAVTAFEGPPESALNSAGVADPAAGGRDVTTPTASPHFPPTLAALVSLPAEQARRLLREYGLPVPDDENEQGDGDDGANPGPTRGGGRGAARGGSARGGTARGGRAAAERPASVATTAGSDASSWENAGLVGTREDNLNRFMRYIGVGFQVLPGTPIAIGGGTGVVMSPLVERRDCAFNR